MSSPEKESECYDYSAAFRPGMQRPLPEPPLRFARPATAAALLFLSFAVAAADPGKVLHTAFSIAETSFDPVLGWDAASETVIEEISETMLEYEYLARPVKHGIEAQH